MTTRKSLKRIFIFIILVKLIVQVYSRFEFTNVKCDVLDSEYGEYEYCYLKSVNRTYKYASVKLKVNKFPMKKIFINVALLKRLNGYKPFLYNLTFDFCQHMRNPNPGNKVASFFFDLIRPYSNINHTCPYTNDVIVDKVPISFLNHKMTQVLPFPEGDYAINCIILIQDISRFIVKTYFTIS